VVCHTLFAGKRAGANPWAEGASTLERQLPSPAPHHTYDEIPVVA
jgi:cytochrome c oxidase subunit 1